MALHRTLEDHPSFIYDDNNVILQQSVYANVNDIPINTANKNFNLLMFNIRSCRKNFLEFISHFHIYFACISCIVLTETWLTSTH